MLGNLADLLRARHVPHTLRVAIDGPDAAGKTHLADDLARALGADRGVIRLSADDFHQQAETRHRRGRLSAEGYYLDAFDYGAIIEGVVGPLGPGGDGTYRTMCHDHQTDQSVSGETRQAESEAILLFDGVFLLRPELTHYWDITVYLHVEPEETLRRALERDAERFGSPEAVRRSYRTRYLPAQSMYRMIVGPRNHADIALDMTNPAQPSVLRWL